MTLLGVGGGICFNLPTPRLGHARSRASWPRWDVERPLISVRLFSMCVVTWRATALGVGGGICLYPPTLRLGRACMHAFTGV
jgi:hypothetical protein